MADRGELLHFYEFIRQSITEGLLVLNETGHITFANEAIQALLGYGEHTLLDCSFQDLWTGDHTWPEEEIDKARTFETTLRHRDGRFIPVVATISPGSSSSISESHTLVSIMSIAELQRFNEALEHTQRLAGVGTLTASVAHELTNPLSIITATCSNLLYELTEEEITKEELVQYIDLIEQSAFRGARIVNVLRNYVHADQPQMAVTDVHTIVRDSLTLVEQQFLKQANTKIEIEVSPGVKSIVCDHNRITQVLINLLTNARDAMQPQGGTIHLKFWSIPAGGDLPPTEAPEQRAGNQLAGDMFAFSVRDSGHGIAPEVAEHIYDPFFTTKPNGHGTGLGLFIVKGIIEQHNGRIWAENNPDGGATFTVILPQSLART